MPVPLWPTNGEPCGLAGAEENAKDGCKPAAAAEALRAQAGALKAGLGPKMRPGGRQAGTFQFWIDEAALSSGSTSVIQHVLLKMGGKQAGGARPQQQRRRPPSRLLGAGNMECWELLWTRSKHAREAALHMQQGQLVNLIPGLHTITGKKKLVGSLTAAYGEAAWQLTPRSFQLPEDLDAWRQWALEAGCTSDQLWMLKSGANRGKGLSLVRLQDAFEEARRPLQHPQFKRYCVAQQYIAAPHTIQGRKFHIRAWVVVTGHAPLRAYLHRNALVLFSSAPYSCGAADVGRGGGVAPGHVTNYAQNEDGLVWSAAMLRTHLGAERFDALWHDIARSAAKVVAAGLAGVQQSEQAFAAQRQQHERQQQQEKQRQQELEDCMDDLPAPQQLVPEPQQQQQQQQRPGAGSGRWAGLERDSGFQLLGLDYLLEAATLRPWLLEVNEYPSLKVKHSDPATEELVRAAKVGMALDMLGLVRHRLGRLGKRAPAKYSLELRRLGGFTPLMPLFPIGARAEGARVPWTAADFRLQELLVGEGAAGEGQAGPGAAS